MTTDTGAPGGAQSNIPFGLAERFPGLRLPEVPRRFAIFCGDGDDEPELYVWGLQTADRAVAFNAGGGMHRSVSAERIANLVDLVATAYLVWLDDDPDDDPAT
jgi:hypothetical protein